jgi:tetratricopeptide (TPR) repeat protein
MRRGGGYLAFDPSCGRRSLSGLIATAIVVGALNLVLAGCGGSATHAATTTAADYGTLVGAGVHLLRIGNLGAAEQLFEQAITKDSQDPVGHYDLGVALAQQGEARLAVRQYRLALRINPRYVPALYNEAVLITRHDKPTAIFLYRQIIAIKPHSPTALLNLGLLEAPQRGLGRVAYVDLTSAIREDRALRSAVPASLLARLRHEEVHEPVPRRRAGSR